MIIPTLRILRQTTQATDVHGQPVLTVGAWELVAPVKLIFSSQHTTVRTDSSGSHGSALEDVSNVVLLALPTSKVKIDDILTILDNKVTVTQTHRRYGVTGALDHIEIHCAIWK